MRIIDTLAKQKPHRVLASVVFLVSTLSTVYFVSRLAFGDLYEEVKRYKVSGNLTAYLLNLFSDPFILLASIVTVSLFGLNLVVTWRALKYSEYAAPLHAIGLLLNVVVFFGFNYITMFGT